MCENAKCGFACRLLKIAVWCIAGAAVLAVLLAATVPLWIGPVATTVAEKVVPGLTGTGFRIDRFCLNPYSGTLSVAGVKLSNPEGFGEAAAFSLAGFNVEVEAASLFSDTVVVKEVAVDDAFVSYYSHGGKNNFDVIMANVEKATGPKKESAKEEKSGPDKPSKKVIIDRLRISGTKIKLMKSDMMPPLLLPSVELTGIGRKSQGATLEEAWTQISEAVMKSMAAVGDGLGALGGLLGDGAQGLGEVLGGAAGKLPQGASDAASKTVDAVGGAAKDAADAVGDTTKKAADGVKNLFKGFGK